MNLLAELRRRWWLVLLVILIVGALIGPRLATFYTDVLWYRSIGFADILWGVLRTQAGIGVLTGAVMAVLVGANLLLARRLAPPFRIPSDHEETIERYRTLLEPYARWVLVVVAVVAGLLSGASMVGQWRTFLLWLNGGGFGIDDPHFGMDLGFFVFDLPFLTTINDWLFTALTATILLTAVAHYLFGGIRPQSPAQKITPGANIHLSVLLAALVAVRAWGFWLDRFMLSYSPRGGFTGLSYTDVNAQLRAYELLTGIAVVCVLLFLANIRYRGWVLPSAGVGILVVAAVLLGGVYPAVIQRLQVDPQELPREREFLERNLAYTRYGYDIESGEDTLDGPDITYERFPAAADLTAAEVNDNAPTLESIRVWDPATLENTYEQLQQLRPFDPFADVDVDRYEIDGDPQQVMLSARELALENLPSPTWQNERVIFTHGFGVVSSRVSTAAADGQPEFLASGIPVEGEPVFEALEQPRIYFGEAPPEYSIVGTSEDELDFETDEGQEFYRYTGADGVPVGNLLNRIAFALRYSEPNILLSGLIDGESRILYNRDIQTRVGLAAPFLQLDHDPYPVVVDGGIQYIQDAYTITDMLPYSERLDLASVTSFQQRQLVPVQAPDGSVSLQERVVLVAGLQGEANYIRNSVKAVVDAYDGTVTLYVNDPDDPIIQAWMRAFPGVFTPMDEASEELREHFRYPEDMFRVQSELLRTYHIPGADAFYSASDAWDIPEDLGFRNSQTDGTTLSRPFPPTYQLLRLPGAEVEDFALIQPFTPREREVLSAYLAASGNPETYGQLRMLLMPPGRTVFGPEQVFARVQQDDEVSQQITLWSESGSTVIYGNLIVVPIEDSLLYAQPLFLRAEQSDIPELRRIVLVFGDRVVMAPRLTDGLEALFGDLPDIEQEEEAIEDGEVVETPAAPPPSDEGDGVTLPGDVQELLSQALEAFAEADMALQQGDLGRYQELVDRAEELLVEVQEAIGGPVPESGDGGQASADDEATEGSS